MNSKAEFFRLAGSTVVIEYKDRSIITSIKIIEFGEKTTKFILLNGDEVTIDNNQKLTRKSISIFPQSNYSMKCKLSSYVVKHSLTTLKYNNISQVCPYKNLGSAKDYIIILLFLMQPNVCDKPEEITYSYAY